MPNDPNPYRDEEMKLFFSTLPPTVQEMIMQCNPGLKNLAELRECARQLQEKN